MKLLGAFLSKTNFKILTIIFIMLVSDISSADSVNSARIPLGFEQNNEYSLQVQNLQTDTSLNEEKIQLLSNSDSKYSNNVTMDPTGRIRLNADDNIDLLGYRTRASFSNALASPESISLVVGDSENNIITVKRQDGFIEMAKSYNVDSLNQSWTKTIGLYDAYALEVDSNDNIYLLGFSKASATHIIKYSSEGQVLRVINIDNEMTRAFDMALDSNNNIFITGTTENPNFEILNEIDGIIDLNEAFIRKYDPNGLISWSTFIGGSLSDVGNHISINSMDEVIFSGYTYSNDFPVVNSFLNNSLGELQGFIGKISNDGQTLHWSVVLEEYQTIADFVMDSENDIYILGHSNDIPNYISSSNPFQNYFILKFTKEGDGIIFGDYLFSEQTSYTGLTIDNANNLILFGETSSTLFPLKESINDPTVDTYYSDRGFISKYSGEDLTTLWSTYLGNTVTQESCGVRCKIQSGYREQIKDVIVDEMNNIISVGSQDVLVIVSQPYQQSTLPPSRVYRPDLTIPPPRVDSKIRSRINILYESAPPSAPMDLIGIGGDNLNQLNWTFPINSGNTPIVKYHIYRSIDEAANHTYYDTIKVDEQSSISGRHLYTDNNVTNGQMYSYRISAENNNGEGEASVSLSLIPEGPPTDPQGLVLLQGNNNSSLIWNLPINDGGQPISSYTVWRGSASGVYTHSFQATTSSFIDTTALNGYTYYYSVVANNIHGSGDYSNEVRISLLDVPSGPRDLSVSNLNGYVQLKWLEPFRNGGSSLEFYRLYRKIIGERTYQYITTTDDLEFVDTTTNLGIMYAYVVTAGNSIGESVYSNEDEVLSAELSDAPPYLVAEGLDSVIILDWDKPQNNGGSEISSYNIYRSIDSGNFISLSNTVDTSFTDTEISEGSFYSYKVSAINLAGESQFSSVVRAKILPRIYSPQNLSSEIGDSKIKLFWEMSEYDPTTIFKVFRSSDSGISYNLIALTTDTEFVDTTPRNRKTYSYRVITSRQGRESYYSNEISVTPSGPFGWGRRWSKLTPYSPVVALSREIFGTGINIADQRWQKIDSYNIYRKTGINGSYQILTNTESNYFLDTSIIQDQTYYYKVTTLSQRGESEFSNENRGTHYMNPITPKGVISEVVDGDIKISWDPSNNSSDFLVYRKGINENSFYVISFTSGNSIIDTTVELGLEYSYFVASLLEGVKGNSSEIVSNVATKLPAAPLKLISTLNGGNVILQWEKPISDGGSPILYYNIYRETRVTGMALIGSTTDLTYTDNTLSLNQTITAFNAQDSVNGSIFYTVTAVNQVGESHLSNAMNSVPGWLYDAFVSAEDASFASPFIILIVFPVLLINKKLKAKRRSL